MESSKLDPKTDEETDDPTFAIVPGNTLWISFVGSFAHILKMLKDSKKLLNELNHSDVINEKSFAVQIVSCIKSLKEDCKQSMLLEESLIKKIEMDETKIVCSENLEESNSLIMKIRLPKGVFNFCRASSAEVGHFPQ